MNYSSFIKAEIDKHGYLTGQDLNNKLMEKFSITPENGRKIIQRSVAQGHIKSTSPVTFGKNQFVYFNRPLNKAAIMHVTKKHRPAMYRLLAVLECTDGVVSYYEALKVTSSPLKREKTKMDHLDRIVQDLLYFNLIMEIQTYNEINYIIHKTHEAHWRSAVNRHEMMMKLDCTFIRDVLVWLQKHNIINSESVVYRSLSLLSKGAQHNNFVWDAFSYTSTTGLTDDRNESKNTLVVLDVQLSRPYAQHDLDGFYNRVQGVICSSINKTRKVLPIIILNNTTDKIVQNRLKKLGFISFDLGTIYGERVYEIIKSLDRINDSILYHSEPSILIDEVKSTLDILKETGQELNLQNLKGDLFEVLMYSVLRRIIGEGDIEQNVILKEKDKEGQIEKYEYDLIYKKKGPRERIIIELKGYKESSIIELGDSATKNTIRWFFRKTLPFAQSYYNKIDRPIQHPLKACFITTAQFSDKALAALIKLNQGNLKPSMLDTFYDGNKLKKLLKEGEFTRELDILEKYFFEKHLQNKPSDKVPF
ncbi:hypothetical protein [Paenibacillus sp. FSL R10-2736]|uniref:hypothetical protein n=1 Tax=Paenibacillus sp. FSL R10-2736 TaxID=2954692 RepID=UPI0030F632A1